MYAAPSTPVSLTTLRSNQATIRAVAHARLCLESGYTAAVSAGALHRVDVALRDAIRAGIIDGPRLAAAGRDICATAGMLDWNGSWLKLGMEGLGIFADGVEECRKAARLVIKEGADIVKTYVTGEGMIFECTAEEVTYSEEEIRVDVYRSSGPGGQSVNTTDSAVRLTHIPTGVVVSCQNEKSQLQNKASAMVILKAKLLAIKKAEERAQLDELRGDVAASWGDQMRSYVLNPYQMVKDLRTEYEVGNPQAVFDGDIDGFLEAGIRWRRGADNLNTVPRSEPALSRGRIANNSLGDSFILRNTCR